MADSRVKHVRIDALDRPLHRIFPVWRFEEVLKLEQLTLVKPSMWIDPREDPCSNFVLTAQPGSVNKKAQRPLADYLADAWAQCWSYELNSDLLLRSYSRVILDPIAKRNTTPGEEGVRVTTTARRLLAAMNEWANKHQDFNFFLAGVTYETEEEFGQKLAGRLGTAEGPLYFSKPDGRAESLCTKRHRFRHESEVRLLCVGQDRLGVGDDIRRFSVNPNDLFTEVAFDPRLITFERREREQWFRTLGYDGTILDDISYMGVMSLIQMSVEWPDPE